MPKRTKKTTRRRASSVKVPNVDVTEEDTELLTEEEQPAGIFDSFGDDSYTAVFWHNPVSKQQEYQGRIDSNPTEQDVQEFCGGGKYTIREMARDEDGKMMYKRQRTITLAGNHFEPKIKRPKDNDSKPEVEKKDEISSSLTNAITAQIINLLNQGQVMTKQQVDGMAALLETIRKQSEQPRDDTLLQLLLAVMQQQTSLIQSIATGRQDQPNPIDMIEKLSTIVRNTSGSPGGTVKDVIESMESVANMKLALSELNQQPRDPMDRAINMFVDYLPQMIEMAKQEHDPNKLKAQVRKQLLSTNPQAPSQSAQQQQGEQQMQPWQMALQAYRKTLLIMAQNDTDPETQAEATFQLMPSNAKAALRTLLADPEGFQKAMAFLPELQPYHLWAGRFFQVLHMNFFPDAYDDDGNLIGGNDNVVVENKTKEEETREGVKDSTGSDNSFSESDENDEHISGFGES